MNTESIFPEIARSVRSIPPPDAIEFSVIGLNGDTKLIWDKTKTVEVESARDTFARLRKAGYLCYKVTGEKGDKGETVTEFNPNEERLIFSPAMAGG